MKKLLVAIISPLVFILCAAPALAGAGGTTISNYQTDGNNATLDVISSIITTKSYSLSYSTNSLTSVSPGEYTLNLIVNSAADTYPTNNTTYIETRVTLLNPIQGKNTLTVQVVGPKDGSLSSSDVIYNLGANYTFDFSPASSNYGHDALGATSTDVLNKEAPNEEQPAVEDQPDLTVKVTRIDYVSVKKNKTWVKNYKLTVVTTNSGEADAEGPVFLIYQPPTTTIKGVVTTPLPTLQMISGNGLKQGKKITKYLYVDKLDYKKNYKFTVELSNPVQEKDIANNETEVTVKTFK